jgi:hypothetical protein
MQNARKVFFVQNNTSYNDKTFGTNLISPVTGWSTGLWKAFRALIAILLFVFVLILIPMPSTVPALTLTRLPTCPSTATTAGYRTLLGFIDIGSRFPNSTDPAGTGTIPACLATTTTTGDWTLLIFIDIGSHFPNSMDLAGTWARHLKQV